MTNAQFDADEEPELIKRLKAPNYPRFTWEDAQRDICFELQDGTSYRGNFLMCVALDEEEKPLFVLMMRTSMVSWSYLAFDDPSIKRWWWPHDQRSI